MKYKAYPEYKDSGMNWISEIPVKWEVKKLRFLGELDSSGVDKKIREDELLYKSVHYMDVYRNSLSEIGSSDDYLIISADENKVNKCLLKKGDVLFTNSSETPEDIGHSTVVIEDLIDTLFGYHLMRFRAKEKLDIKCQKYLFGSDILRSWFEHRANGITRYGITSIDFADALVILPPIPEQILIAKFLDRETARIESIITAKSKLIEKLKEKRNAVISYTVTKGLEPNAKMKSSGIEWIGEIPEEWIVSSFKWYGSVKSGDFIEKEYLDTNGDYPVIGGNGIMAYSNTYNCDKQTIVIGRVGALCGNIHRINFNCWITDNALFIYRYSKSKMNLDYFKYFLFSMNLNSLASQTAQPLITGELVKKQKICLPSIEEQINIANYLDDETARLDAIIIKTQSSIVKLKEYQKSLISAAVTGKIDVRGE